MKYNGVIEKWSGAWLLLGQIGPLKEDSSMKSLKDNFWNWSIGKT